VHSKVHLLMTKLVLSLLLLSKMCSATTDSLDFADSQHVVEEANPMSAALDSIMATLGKFLSMVQREENNGENAGQKNAVFFLERPSSKNDQQPVTFLRGTPKTHSSSEPCHKGKSQSAQATAKVGTDIADKNDNEELTDSSSYYSSYGSSYGYYSGDYSYGSYGYYDYSYGDYSYGDYGYYDDEVSYDDDYYSSGSYGSYYGSYSYPYSSSYSSSTSTSTSTATSSESDTDDGSSQSSSSSTGDVSASSGSSSSESEDSVTSSVSDGWSEGSVEDSASSSAPQDGTDSDPMDSLPTDPIPSSDSASNADVSSGATEDISSSSLTGLHHIHHGKKQKHNQQQGMAQEVGPVVALRGGGRPLFFHVERQPAAAAALSQVESKFSKKGVEAPRSRKVNLRSVE